MLGVNVRFWVKRRHCWIRGRYGDAHKARWGHIDEGWPDASEDVGRLAQEAGVKTLALSHLTPAIDSIGDDTWREPVAKFFKDGIIVGKDRMVVWHGRVRFVPEADNELDQLFDHVAGAREQRRRNFKAQWLS